MPPLELARLATPHWNALPREQTVFFFTLAPLEDHGPHLPVGLDLFEAQELSQRLATRVEEEMPGWKAVLLPPLALGANTNTGRFALRVSGRSLKEILLAQCIQLQKLGFRHFACLSGHLGARQLSAIEEVGRALRLRHYWWGFRRIFPSCPKPPSFYSLSATLVPKEVVLRSPLWLDPKEHGGARDTSVGLALVPNQIRTEGADGYPNLKPSKRKASVWSRSWDYCMGRVQGYWGTPSEASSAKGLAVLQEQTQAIFPRFRATLEGKADPLQAFRTWFAAFPPNRTHFKAWIWAFIGILLLWILGFLSIEMMGGFQLLGL